MSPGHAAALRLTLNGAPHEAAAGTTLAELTQQLELTHGRFAVEIDGVVVPRSQHAERTLRSGEKIEIVTFVGGG
ncbi:MAG: sulfur carrier protein ThiS [Planctomycetota bacterium]|nr:MAG: sulfur carrier protein ThiS [Planctomycetota bacterium]